MDGKMLKEMPKGIANITYPGCKEKGRKMAEYHPACKDCVLSNGECLLQSNSDVESCEDVREYDIKKMDN